MIEIGTWRNFDDLEECLLLDELLLLSDALNTKNREQFKMMAAVQGIEVPDEPEDRGDEDLPPELIEQERLYREKLKSAATGVTLADGMLAYERET